MKYKKPGEMYNAMMKKHHKMTAHKNWIANAVKHPGALHRQLGVAAGSKIPTKKLASAAKKGGKEGKRARLAETLKSFHHKKRKMTKAEDKAFDRQHRIKEGSAQDKVMDNLHGVKDKKRHSKKHHRFFGWGKPSAPKPAAPAAPAGSYRTQGGSAFHGGLGSAMGNLSALRHPNIQLKSHKKVSCKKSHKHNKSC